MSEETSKEVASDAGHLLSVLDELEAELDVLVRKLKQVFSEARSVAGSALTQAKQAEDDD